MIKFFFFLKYSPLRIKTFLEKYFLISILFTQIIPSDFKNGGEKSAHQATILSKKEIDVTLPECNVHTYFFH